MSRQMTARRLTRAEMNHLRRLLWIGGEFEDSADHKSGRSNRGNTGPLTAAVQNLFQRFLVENPSAIPDPFAPGGPFYGVPRQEMAPNGTVQDSATGTHRPQPGRFNPHG
ncbi:hypothetical protein [Klebsiella pneumoniae]